MKPFTLGSVFVLVFMMSNLGFCEEESGIGSISEELKAAPKPPGPPACLPGYVWRQAGPNDHVCVRPQTRSQTADDNRQGPTRRNPAGGPYGSDTCLQGYVWREAFAGDHVCVSPATRSQAADDNSQAAARVRLGKMLLSNGDPGLAINAWGGAKHGTVLRLYRGCLPSNPDCTWTYLNGMLISDSDATLAINAWGGQAMAPCCVYIAVASQAILTVRGDITTVCL